MTMPAVRVPKNILAKAKQRQAILRKKGITRPLFELVAEALAEEKQYDEFRGGLRL